MNRLYNILNKLVGYTQVETREYTSNGTVTVTKVGKVVNVAFWGAVSRSTSARTDIATLPVGWRPAATILNGNISGVGYGDVTEDGVIQVFRSDGANQRVDTSLTYVATQ